MASLVVGVAACQAAPPPAVVTPPPSTPRSFPTPAGERTVGLAVIAVPPTPTPELVADYPVLVRPRLERIEAGLKKLEETIGQLRQAPARMMQDDWRAQMSAALDELANANADLRGLGARTGPDASLSSDVSKLVTDLGFVVDEYRMAIDFDPDGSHFTRAGRAEKTTADEVDSILLVLRRRVGAPGT